MPVTDFSSPQSSGAVAPDPLEEILQRIHDNVYSHPLLPNQTNPLADHLRQMDALLLPPPPPDLLEKVTALRSAQAPYYIVSGSLPVRIVKRLHNLVLKVFGRKQAYYNNLTLDLLESTVSYLHILQEHTRAQASLIEALITQVMLQIQTEQSAARQAEGQEQAAEPQQNERQ
jgi:hypothetical protein